MTTSEAGNPLSALQFHAASATGIWSANTPLRSAQASSLLTAYTHLHQLSHNSYKIILYCPTHLLKGGNTLTSPQAHPAVTLQITTNNQIQLIIILIFMQASNTVPLYIVNLTG